MKEYKDYKNISEYSKDFQMNKLEQVIHLLHNSGYLQEPEKLVVRTKKPLIAQARRMIALLARMKFNIAGSVIAQRLNLDESQVFAIIYSGFERCKVDEEYRAEIEALIEKLQCK